MDVFGRRVDSDRHNMMQKLLETEYLSVFSQSEEPGAHAHNSPHRIQLIHIKILGILTALKNCNNVPLRSVVISSEQMRSKRNWNSAAASSAGGMFPLLGGETADISPWNIEVRSFWPSNLTWKRFNSMHLLSSVRFANAIPSCSAPNGRDEILRFRRRRMGSEGEL